MIDLIIKDEQIGEDKINGTSDSLSIMLTGGQMKQILREKDAQLLAKQKFQQETENQIKGLEQDRDELR